MARRMYFDQVLCMGWEIEDADIDALCHAMKEEAVKNTRNEEQKAVVKDVGRQQLRSWGIVIEKDGKFYPTNAYAIIRNEALAYAFSYMNLIEHWGSGIPRIIGRVRAAGLQEPEFIGGEVDLRINIYRSHNENADFLQHNIVDTETAEKVPTTEIKCRESAGKMPITNEKCREMNRKS